jgi:four helix bundle protein
MALTFVDMIYSLAETLPRTEENNLKSQMVRAGTSIVLNIAEGSTSQTDSEQRRFLSMALRSLMETVACQHLTGRRRYSTEDELTKRYEFGQVLFNELQAMRRTLKSNKAKEL